MNIEVKENDSSSATQIKDNKKMKLYKALENNLKISELNLPNKFEHFEQWELNKSNRLLYEINNNQKTFKRFKKGMIIKVDFGVNVGGEFSGPHFAIVLSKKDHMYNNKLTVIPLSSKKHKNALDLGNLIINMYIDNLVKESEQLNKTIAEIDIETYEFTPEFKNKIKNIGKILNYYKKNENNLSYAYVDQIKTISKLNIISPINEYDIVNKFICSDDIIKSIDLAIIKQFTSMDYEKIKKLYDECK